MQALIFNPYALAPTFPESAITKPFPFNGYYDLEDAPEVDGKDMEIRGARPCRQQEILDAG